jgi:4a-hydroxytetrahydrobiopterin dehydratase
MRGVSMPGLATDQDINSFLNTHDRWARRESGLSCEFTAPSFEKAIALVNSVAKTAEEMDHHPDIDIRWTSVTFTASTHSAGGITSLDFELATAIDAAAANCFG